GLVTLSPMPCLMEPPYVSLALLRHRLLPRLGKPFGGGTGLVDVLVRRVARDQTILEQEDDASCSRTNPLLPGGSQQRRRGANAPPGRGSWTRQASAGARSSARRSAAARASSMSL